MFSGGFDFWWGGGEDKNLVGGGSLLRGGFFEVGGGMIEFSACPGETPFPPPLPGKTFLLPIVFAPYFRFKKKILRKSSKAGHGNLFAEVI